ncbi:hypothetical protein [Pararhodobacter sp.]|uniref:hypothetical protein n=1 Tax=Pararhodobacter sp. TaxID=2127056 RepID=UPI002AFF08A5|nr:hypothetical protein [Pararhodobacter sp.]
MARVESRQNLIDRLVDLNGGKASVRAIYETFDDAGLQQAVTHAEAAAQDIKVRGRLASVWSDDAPEIERGQN